MKISGKQLTLADVIVWSGILIIGLLLLAAVLSLQSCMSYKYDDCAYERTTTTEKILNCPAGTGKEVGTVPFPGNNF